jgi:Peptidase family M23
MRSLVAVLAAASLIQAPAAAGWTWPVDGPVVRTFAFGSDPYAAGQHRGIDIGAAPGTTVRAAAAGTVSFAGTVPSGGRTVTVQTPGGLSVTYLELGATRVARGTDVAEGDEVGAVGSAEHVHLGVRVTADAHGYLDPLQFLPARPAAPARPDAPDPPVPAAAQVQPAAGGDPLPPVAAEPASKAKAEPEPASKAVVDAEPAPKAVSEPAPRPKPESEPVQPTQAPPTAVREPSPAADAHAPVAPVAADALSASEEARGLGLERLPAAAGRNRTEVSAAKDDDTSEQRPSRSDPRGAAAESDRARRGTGPGTTRPAFVDERPRGGATHEKWQTDAAGVVRGNGGPTVVARAPGLTDTQQGPRVGYAALTGCLALLLLGIGMVVRRIRRPHESLRSVCRAGQARCPLGRTRPPRLIHACARSRQAGWPTSETRRRRLAVPRGPLPRPRRRSPVGVPA